MKILKYILPIIGITLLFGSCRMGKNYTRPELDTPESFIYANGDTSYNATLRWWDLFNDPVLDTLIHKALNNNKDLLATAQNVEAARLQLAIQKADLLPQFNYSGTAGRGNFQGFSLPEPTNAFNIVGQASWEIDFWGKLRRMNETARAQYLASEYGLNALRLSLITTVATTYFQVLEFRAKTVIAEQTYAIRDSSYLILQQRFNAGIIPAIDVNHSRIQKAVAATAIPQYKRLAAQSENLLNVLIGENPQLHTFEAQLDDFIDIPDVPAGIPSDILNRRPDILMAEQQLVAQNALVGVAQAARLPSISLTGMFGLASDDLSTLTSGDPAWNISGSLLGPIFNWGKNTNRVKAERARTEAAVYQYENAVLNAFREVEDALLTIKTLKEEELAIQEHVEAATEAASLSADRYDKGIASYIEFLESQRQAFDAQMLLTGNKQDILEAYIRLYQALGGGWQ
ncbi:TolC family protein [Carboxylicivirga sediminis]|uniref:TolC family protein n=1 Tax=Carboxylicivirga sediminis TaxID=2006564 RepID=A0A941F6X9_9BACT|nr:TolC family protein [Carboxylicivirga sediminis]MBR8537936.1 TolC family protein [Carboxylicivirga sediminis]